MSNFYDYTDLLDMTDKEAERMIERDRREYAQAWEEYISEFDDDNYRPESYKKGAGLFE